MLSGINRLKKKKDFEKAFKQGKGAKEGFLSFRFVKNGLPAVRFGFVVGQKVSKKATVRNKVKRLFREASQRNLAAMEKGFDVVVIASSGAVGKNLKEIEETFSRLLKMSKLIKD